jgi:hypothetical protein
MDIAVDENDTKGCCEETLKGLKDVDTLSQWTCRKDQTAIKPLDARNPTYSAYL